MDFGINLSPIFALTANVCALAARLRFKTSLPKSIAIGAIVLVGLYGLFMLAFWLLRREG